MAWIELHQSLPTHRKTLALAEALKIQPVQAVGHLCCLFLWALDNATAEGDLQGASNTSIAVAAQWRGNSERFVGALVKAGFLDEGVIHDWPDYSGRLNDQRQQRRQANREAQQRRRQRLRHNGVVMTTDDSHDDSHADTADNKQSTVPNRTQPYRTDDTAVSSSRARARAALTTSKREDDDEEDEDAPEPCRQCFKYPAYAPVGLDVQGDDPYAGLCSTCIVQQRQIEKGLKAAL